MTPMPFIAIIIFVLLIVGAVFAYFSLKISREEFKKTGKHPKGHYMGLGLAYGMALGIPLGIALDNIALGPAMGLPIGLAMGAALEKKHQDELRPLTEKEEKMRRTAVLFGIGLVVLGVAVFFVVDFLLPNKLDENNKPQNEFSCNISELNLRETTKYGIFGDDEFDTVVTGYFQPRKETIWEEEINVAFFVITDFYDEGFKASIEKGISEGNTVNSKIDDSFLFNLGCFEDNKITGIEYPDSNPYIDELTQERIINSSIDNPVTLILSFGKHAGRGCTCCNLAHKVRVCE